MAFYSFRLRYPVDMTVHRKSQGFGENPSSYSRFGLKGHNGIDWYPIDGRRDHLVYPTDVGTVSKVYIMDSGWGNAVRIRHSWGESIYGHFLETPKVTLGQRVELNTALGIEDSTGNSTGTHIHFGVYPNGVSTSNGYSGAVDPESIGFYSYSPPTGTGPGGITTPVRAGKVTVLPLVGLRMRTEPSIYTGKVLMTLPFGTELTVEDETKTVGNVVFRKVALWVAESEAGTVYIKNV